MFLLRLVCFFFLKFKIHAALLGHVLGQCTMQQQDSWVALADCT